MGGDGRPVAEARVRPALSIHASRRREAAKPFLERLLQAIGSDPRMTECVLGDIAEERAERTARHGALHAFWWYVRETMRSAPWLVASAVRRAGWRGHAWLAAAVGIVATVGVAIVLSMTGDPARLVVEGDRGDGVVVNNLGAVKLGMRVLDARGHLLPDSGVRYRWAGGTPIPVSATGVAKCTRGGDATVRATLGSLATTLLLRCRPVSTLASRYGLALVVGEQAAPIPFVALDATRRIVSPLRGAITVADTSIAVMERASDGQRLLRARAPGSTRVDVSVGDRTTSVFVNAFGRRSSFNGIKPGDRVAIRVRVRTGEVRQWSLVPSRELYVVRMIPDGDEEQMPAVAISGANCVDEGRHAFMCAAPHGAQLFAYYPAWGNQSMERRGDIAVERREYP